MPSQKNSIGPAVSFAALATFVLCALFHFSQYAVRSAPGVMLPELSANLGLPTTAIGGLIGAYYYSYSLTNLVAGGLLDKFGARVPVAVGMLLLAAGCALFTTSNPDLALAGRLLQGGGAAFAFVGAVYVATKNFQPGQLALAIGVAQAFGMFGGASGQFVVAHLMHGANLPWTYVWFGLAIFLCMLAVLLVIFARGRTSQEPLPFSKIVEGYKIVFLNPRSWLCGLCGGFLFLPTTLGDMIWRVVFFTQGLGITYDKAVSSASLVLFGWVIGCPLLGWISDRLGRRKPVIIAGGLILLAAECTVLYGPAALADNIPLSLLFGIVSGAAMIPYTMIKEVNPPHVAGTATGIMNLMVFALSAIISLLVGNALARLGAADGLHAAAFREVGIVLVIGIVVAIVAAILLPETGRAARRDEAEQP